MKYNFTIIKIIFKEPIRNDEYIRFEIYHFMIIELLINR